MSQPGASLQELEFDDVSAARAVFGHHDANLRMVERLLDARVHARGTMLRIEGRGADAAMHVVRELYAVAKRGLDVDEHAVRQACAVVDGSPDARLHDVMSDVIVRGAGGRPIAPKTLAQKAYVDAIRTHDVVFGVGPAGTGKTYLAMALAVASLLEQRVKRIVLTRPAVEAGERLGFLPGDLADKVSPYLRPLYDALFEMVDVERANHWIERGIVEVAPLAFMRGRTLNASFVILDEAQNTTREQMKMLLTRLGFDARLVVTGDVTQVDLEDGGRSGLRHAVGLLSDVEGIAVRRFTGVDVVRHPLVRRIISAYDREATDTTSGGATGGSAPIRSTEP